LHLPNVGAGGLIVHPQNNALIDLPRGVFILHQYDQNLLLTAPAFINSKTCTGNQYLFFHNVRCLAGTHENAIKNAAVVASWILVAGFLK